MDKLAIGPGTRVTLHFSLALEDGTTIDSNFDGAPVEFVIGDGNLLPDYERALFGLREGDDGLFQMLPEQGFGQHNPNNIQEMSLEDFPDDIDLRPGLVVSFADAARAELPGVIASIEDDRVFVDFNHPLAGHTITFTVTIRAVEPAVTH